MRFTIVCTALAAALPASAARMFRVEANTIDYPWEVSEWNAACSNVQKCTYSKSIPNAKSS